MNLLLEKGFGLGEIGIHGISYGAAITLLATEEVISQFSQIRLLGL